MSAHLRDLAGQFATAIRTRNWTDLACLIGLVVYATAWAAFAVLVVLFAVWAFVDFLIWPLFEG